MVVFDMLGTVSY